MSDPLGYKQGMFETGAMVGGLYRVDSKIGEGAFGEVWSGTIIATGQRIALKRLHASVAANTESINRFRREAELLERVQSEYVAKLINFLPDPNHGLVLVLEFIDGAPLSDLFNVQTLSVELAIDIGIDMLFALRDLHAARIIHRDIKPANVIMRPMSNGDSQAVVCDFSMSRLAARPAGSTRTSGSYRSLPSLTPSNVTLGTLQYMSPEQILSSRDVSERTDLYAVGAVLFRGVAGTHVFSESSGPQSIARAKLMNEAPPLNTGRTDSVARAFEEAIARSLRRRPQDRYESASEMLDVFLHLHKLAADALESDSAPTMARRSLIGDELSSLNLSLPLPPPSPHPPAPSTPSADIASTPPTPAVAPLQAANTAPPAAVSAPPPTAPSPASPSKAPTTAPKEAAPIVAARPLGAPQTARLEQDPPTRSVPLKVFVIALGVVFALGLTAGLVLRGGSGQSDTAPRPTSTETPAK